MPPPSPAEFAAELTAFVDPHAIPDYAVTGLQVAGSRPINKLAMAVSANLASFADADAWGADAVLVHHGLFWETDDPDKDPARPIDERRAAFLRARGMSLLAYHLPLDAHPVVGNNAEIARLLGLVDPVHDFAPVPGTSIGIGLTARADPPVPVAALGKRIAGVIGRAPIIVRGNDGPIRTVAVLSGGGSGYAYEAAARGCDAYVTGEGREWMPALARELGLTVFVLGHHASETFGVRALGQWAANRFGIETQFLAQENPF